MLITLFFTVKYFRIYQQICSLLQFLCRVKEMHCLNLWTLLLFLPRSSEVSGGCLRRGVRQPRSLGCILAGWKVFFFLLKRLLLKRPYMHQHWGQRWGTESPCCLVGSNYKSVPSVNLCKSKGFSLHPFPFLTVHAAWMSHPEDRPYEHSGCPKSTVLCMEARVLSTEKNTLKFSFV